MVDKVGNSAATVRKELGKWFYTLEVLLRKCDRSGRPIAKSAKRVTFAQLSKPIFATGWVLTEPILPWDRLRCSLP